MVETVKRSYRSELRDEAARRTRRRIREVAARRFVVHGYVTTTIRDIAGDAGVAVRTVHNAYPGGKAEIFAEALDAALGGDERRIPLADRAVSGAVLAAPDPGTAVAAIVEGAVVLYERAGPLIATYHESAGADPEMRRHADEGAREAARIMRRFGRSLHELGALRGDLSPERAGDALLALCSPHLHRVLREQCRWSVAAYRDWLRDTIERTILTGD